MIIKNLMIILVFAIISVAGRTANAQNRTASSSAGLYLTASDFEQQKLSYAIDCSNGNDKIKTNEFFGSPSGYVITKGEKHEFSKKDVYGYRNCKSKNYRFYNGEAYLLVDTAGFYIYYQYRLEENVKGKSLIKKDAYFFSKTPTGDLQLLTIDNLKSTFAANSSFRYALDANFRSDKDLLAYDSFGKYYKVKYLFKQQVK